MIKKQQQQVKPHYKNADLNQFIEVSGTTSEVLTEEFLSSEISSRQVMVVCAGAVVGETTDERDGLRWGGARWKLDGIFYLEEGFRPV
ncbi:hypothetical protein L484_012222 [Morus notabilis]|uniref:Uncharacterized protein n=1 Tax=Morus notabilis TaxID=981085 RepID=W9QNA7_9ROSA|nr:hypothetical protein L484_012222 [Morus notabilis]